MTDHKFTDDAIDIKKYAEALNHLIGADFVYYQGDKYVNAIVEIIVLAKKMENTIKSQKAEIERLQAVHADMTESLRLAAEANKDMQAEIAEYQKHIDNDIIYVNRVKAEAIKEFAERLKSDLGRISQHQFTRSQVEWSINTFVKEMTE